MSRHSVVFALLSFALLSHFFRTDVASHCWHSHYRHSHSCLFALLTLSHCWHSHCWLRTGVVRTFVFRTLVVQATAWAPAGPIWLVPATSRFGSAKAAQLADFPLFLRLFSSSSLPFTRSAFVVKGKGVGRAIQLSCGQRSLSSA